MKPLPSWTATRFSRLLLWVRYRILRTGIVTQPGHRASQIASGIAASCNPQGV